MTRPRLHLVDVEVRLRRPLLTAAGAISTRRSIIVGWETGATTGWGEAPAFPSGRFGTADEAWDDLSAPKLWPDGLPAVGIAAAALQAAQADHAAKAAGEPLHRYLGGSNSTVLARHPIGLIDPDEVPDAARAIDAADVTAVKVKIAPGRDIDPLGSLRKLLPSLDIGVDANGAYSDPNDPVFERLDAIGVGFVEQPFPAGDIGSHTALRGRFSMAVCLDETTDDADALQAAFEKGACDSIAVKVNRHGLARLDRFRADAADAGVDVRIGGTFDTSIGRRHVLAAATLPGVIDAEAGPPSAYLDSDLADYPTVIDGHVEPADAPGIGVEPDRDQLERLARRRTVIEL